jgi:NAD(P)-dependent dehydrogenase (short-subunit alcohol dehydrogenase family)
VADECVPLRAGQREETQDGVELHMATNCLGPHLLTLLLLPCLRAAAQVHDLPPPQQYPPCSTASAAKACGSSTKAFVTLTPTLDPKHRAQARGAPPARVVNVSSRMHRLATVPRRDPQLRRRFGSVAAYSVSKTAQVGWQSAGYSSSVQACRQTQCT